MLASFIKKEFLVISRDIHGLLLLFIMPVIFITIMSMALKNQFEQHGSVKIYFYMLDNSANDSGSLFLENFQKESSFARRSSELTESALRQKVTNNDASFLLIIHEDFSDNFQQKKTGVSVYVSPDLQPSTLNLLQAQIEMSLGKTFIGLLPESENKQLLLQTIDLGGIVNYEYMYAKGTASEVPSSVQQNVPAWLLFGMFFIAVPLSTAIIKERDQGTFVRLRTMRVHFSYFLLGKFVPYFIINMVQVVLMIIVGITLVPMLGGDKLEIGDAYGALLFLSASCSCASVSYALLISQISRTVEQATIITGVLNILMAALGGVMVPRFIMPDVMQQIGLLSPMAWGLDGFLDLFLRNGGIAEVLPESLALFAFAIICCSLTLLASKYHH